ncbi:MAG TPA: twin-arginine translocation signal domain-containing protein [Roseiflexaceae bacterium]
MAHALAYDELLAGTRRLSRRDFIRSVGAAIAAGALLAAGDGLIAAGWHPQIAVSDLLRSTFARHVGDTFQVEHGSGAMLELRLAEVRDLRSPGRRQLPALTEVRRQNSFSLLFAGSIDRTIAQGTYVFEHDRIGRFPLFIVPAAPDRNAAYYEAIFNRS